MKSQVLKVLKFIKYKVEGSDRVANFKNFTNLMNFTNSFTNGVREC